jgi:hemerythrin-like metal-binding protein
LSSLFYTGSSRFLEANENFARALVDTSARCAIHASEDIIDANGLKLWAAGQPIGERLLERLGNRRLRKPIELCVYAPDPVAAAGIAATIEEEIGRSAEFGSAIKDRLPAVLEVVGGLSPNPTELMLLSVMRHSGRDRLAHAARVCALALTAAERLDVHPELMRTLARAAILHDVGELYLAPDLFEAQGERTLAQVREIRSHAAIGAQVAIELARAGATVGQLIAMSHERLDGWGYPAGLNLAEISRPAQALLFAEAMAPLIASGPNGLRRAAVAARLVPGEFPSEPAEWIVQCGSARAVLPQLGASAATIGLDLLQVEALLSRSRSLLADPLARETTVVRRAGVQWSKSIETLMNELRRTGIESAISCGMSVEPQSDTESIELSVLSQELLYRVRELRLRVEGEQSEIPELGNSGLVIEFLELLRACEPAPESTVSPAGVRSRALIWSRLFSVGVREIDDQHRVLFGLLNRLFLREEASDPGDLADKTLEDLVGYVGHHFAYEEQLMREHGYEEAVAHVQAHSGLGRHVAELVARHRGGSTVSLVELTAFLRQWLIAHILRTDRALGAALNKKGIH